MANRTTTLEGKIWADGAPNAPASPVQGTTYAKSNVSESEINNGQPYNQSLDSALWNEILKRITSLIDLSEQYGILPWCPTVNYPIGSFCIGSDGKLYKSLLAPNLNKDPISEPLYWVDPLRNASESYSGLIQIATQAIVTAGTNDSMAVTPLKLAVRLAALLVNTALTGNPTCPTQADGNSSTRIANTVFVNTAINTAISNGVFISDWVNISSNAIAPWTGTAYCAQIIKNSSVIGWIYKIHLTRPVAGGAMSSSILGVPSGYVPASTKIINADYVMETSPIYTSPEISRRITLGTTGYFQINGSRDNAGSYGHSFDFEGVVWA